MPVESVSHIADLDADNPLVTDDVSEGDDHLRNIKKALLADFANIDAAVGCTPAELNFNDGATAGTLVASKTVVAAADKSINLDSGVLTNVNIDTGNIAGAVTGATQSSGDDTTKLATTAFVQDTKWTLLDTFSSTGNIVLGEKTTGVPTTAVGLKFVFIGVFTNAAASHQIVLGGSSTYSVDVVGAFTQGSSTAYFSDLTPVAFRVSTGGVNASYGIVEFTKVDGSDAWIGNGNVAAVAVGKNVISAGQITLAGTLDRMKVELQTSTYAGGSVEVYVRS